MTLKNLLLSILSGITLILIFPNWNVAVLAWGSLVPLLFAVYGKQPYHGFLLGCITGFVFHLGLIYWLIVVMTTYGKLPLAVSLLILILFSLYLCLFIGVPVCCSSYLQQRKQLSFTITLPVFWTASEYSKSWLLTGFPWENLGYSQCKSLALIQIADITGVYGVSFLLVLVNCVIFVLLQRVATKKALPYKELIVCVLFLIGTSYYGQMRLKAFKTLQGEALRVVLVQGNIKQDIKWDIAFLDETMKIYRELTLSSKPDKPDLVIWPEAATPFYFQSETMYQDMVTEAVANVGSHLLFGSPAWELRNGVRKFFNSAFLIAPDREVKGRYDKIHMVPYGEYVPLKKFFPFIDKMVVGIGDFSPGEVIKTLNLAGHSFGTLICYEIIFPDLVRKFVKTGAVFLVNITNDAWFGRTGAPNQHLSMAVFRAVENRRFIARAANTGISAFIDPKGKILQQSKLFTRGTLTGMIYILKEKSFYTQVGDLFAKACFYLSICLAILPIAKRKLFARKKS